LVFRVIIQIVPLEEFWFSREPSNYRSCSTGGGETRMFEYIFSPKVF